MRLPVTLLYPEEPEGGPQFLARRYEIDDRRMLLAASGVDPGRRKQADRLLNDGDVQGAVRQLGQDGAEGVLVVGTWERPGWRVEVHPLGPERLEAFLVPVAGTPGWIDTGQPFTLHRGDHLLVPAVPSREEALAGLMDSLHCLPRDLQLLLLETLRSPGLEERVARLEGTAGVAAASPGLARRDRWWSRAWNETRRWLTRPVPTGLFLLLALPLLLWLASPGTVGGSGRGDGDKDDAGSVTETDELADEEEQEAEAHEEEADSGPGEGAIDDPAEALAALVEAVSASGDPQMKQLHTTHLSEAARTETNLKRDEHRAWATMKVQLLFLGETGLQSAWNTWDFFAGVKEPLRSRLDGLDDNQRAALAYVACEGWDNTTLTRGGGEDVPLGLACEDLDDPETRRQATRHLLELAEFVRGLGKKEEADPPGSEEEQSGEGDPS